MVTRLLLLCTYDTNVKSKCCVCENECMRVVIGVRCCHIRQGLVCGRGSETFAVGQFLILCVYDTQGGVYIYP